MKQNNEWLEACGLTYDGNAIELRNIVKQYMNDPNGPPNILPQLGGDFINVSNVLVSMMRLISFIMTEQVNEEICDKCDTCVKVYLSMVNKFDKELNSDDNKYKPI